jgi:hypothetical protein
LRVESFDCEPKSECVKNKRNDQPQGISRPVRKQSEWSEEESNERRVGKRTIRTLPRMNLLTNLLLQFVVIKVSRRVLVQDATKTVESCEIGIRRAMIVEDYDAERQDESDEKQAPEDDVQVLQFWGWTQASRPRIGIRIHIRVTARIAWAKLGILLTLVESAGRNLKMHPDGPVDPDELRSRSIVSESGANTRRDRKWR